MWDVRIWVDAIVFPFTVDMTRSLRKGSLDAMAPKLLLPSGNGDSFMQGGSATQHHPATYKGPLVLPRYLYLFQIGLAAVHFFVHRDCSRASLAACLRSFILPRPSRCSSKLFTDARSLNPSALLLISAAGPFNCSWAAVQLSRTYSKCWRVQPDGADGRWRWLAMGVGGARAWEGGSQVSCILLYRLYSSEAAQLVHSATQMDMLQIRCQKCNEYAEHNAHTLRTAAPAAGARVSAMTA